MRQNFDLPLDFHGHNDYGLAVPNSIAALRSGAGRVHVTVNGIGERAGNTNLATAGGGRPRSLRPEQQRQRALARHAQRSGRRNQRHRSRPQRSGRRPHQRHPGLRRPRRRRQEGQALSEPPRSRPLRTQARIRSRQDRRNGFHRGQLQRAGNRDHARAAAHVARQGERTGRQQSHRHPGRHHSSSQRDLRTEGGWRKAGQLRVCAEKRRTAQRQP